MNCVELQQSLAEVENGSTLEQRAHLRACPKCSALLRDLNQIVASAGELQASDEPSPRVWNSIEIALRQEGLIRPQRNNQDPERVLRPPSARAGERRDRLVPAAAMLLLLVRVHQRRPSLPAPTHQQAAVVMPVNLLGIER